MEAKKIDYKKVFQEIKLRRKLYAIIIPIVFVLSCLYIVCVPRVYAAEAVVVPEVESAGSSGGSALSSLASTFGLDLSSMQSTDAITPLLYPELMDDNGFVSKLFHIMVTNKDHSISTDYYTYLKKHQEVAWWTACMGWIKGKLTSKKQDLATDGKFNPYNLSKDDSNIVEQIKESIKFTTDKKTGAITISAKAQDPYVCKILVDSVRQHLQVFITNYRTNKARNDVKYYQKLTAEAKAAYEKSRQLYGSYSDANMDVILESIHAKQNDLENDMQLKYNSYSTLSTQLQLAKAKVQERTPAFSLIKGAVVPLRPESPKRMIFVLMMTFFAFAGTTIYVLRDIVLD